MAFEAVEQEEFDIGVAFPDNLELSNSEENTPTNQEDDFEIELPDNFKKLDESKTSTSIQGNNKTNENKQQDVSFADTLRNELQWEDVPDNATPIETIKLLVEMQQNERDSLLARIQELEANSGKYDIEFEQTRKFEEFKKLLPRDAVKQSLMKKNDITEEEAEEDVAELELEGKLDKEYKRLIRREEKQHSENLELISQQKELRKQQEEIQRKELVTNVRSDIQSFNSEYFTITPQDRQMVERAILEPMDNGYTWLQNVLSDNKVVAEMILAYQNLPNFKKLPKTIEKQVQSKILNNMSDDPVLNPKTINTQDALSSWGKHEVDTFKSN